MDLLKTLLAFYASLLELKENKRGSMVGGIIALVVGLATVIVAVMVVLLISGSLYTMSATLLPTNATVGNATSTQINATSAALFANVFSSINLLTILPIIMVAGTIIAAVGGFLMWQHSKS